MGLQRRIIEGVHNRLNDGGSASRTSASGAALAAALTLSTAFAAPPPEVVELEGQWRGRLCTAEGNPTKTNLSIDKYGCFVLFQTDVNGAAQSAGTVTVKEGVMTLVDAKTGPYMVLKVSDDGRLVQDVRGKLPKNCCYLKRR